MSRETQWNILRKLGFSDHFGKVVSAFHTGMKASLSLRGGLSVELKAESGVLALALFSIFFSKVLSDAFTDSTQGV